MDPRPSLFTRLFVLVLLAGLLQELSWSLLVHFPGFLTDLGATEARIGVLYAASAALALVLRPSIGRIMDGTGRRRVLLVAGGINAGALLTLTLVGSFGPGLFAIFIIQRVMQIVLFTAILTFNADIVPASRRAEGLALLGLAGLVPLGTGGILGDVILSGFGFDGLFVTAAAGSALSWFVVWKLPKQVLTGAQQPRRSFFAALLQPDLLPMWLATLLFAVGLEVLFTFMRTYVDERQIGSVGAFFIVYGAIAVVTRLLSSRRLDVVPTRPALAIAMGGFAFAFALLAGAESTAPFVAAALFAGASHGVAFPMMMSQVVGRARIAERGSALASFTALFDIALLGAAPVVGALIDRSGYDAAFGAVSGFLAVGTIVYALWDRPRKGVDEVPRVPIAR